MPDPAHHPVTPPKPTPAPLPPWEETLAESKAWDRWYDPYGHNDDDDDNGNEE
ncbi:hypothetical protein [Streptomyces sp. NPDC057552]|uniref:hypothetical protein n=1 Tax=Streptomyces sp. NPDC057552 TaxID=3350537 RepID=UPI0036AD313C